MQEHSDPSTSKTSAGQLSNLIFYPLLLLAILIGCGIEIYLYKGGLYTVSADESGRTMHAYEWMFNKQLARPEAWLPLPKWITGLALEFKPDLFRTPRALTFGLGILALLALGWLTQELMRDRRVTLLAVLLGALFSHHVILSVVPLSEMMFITAILCGCAFLARWIVRGQTRDLLLGAIPFALSTAIRYEGWVYAGGVFLLAFYVFLRDKPRFKPTVLIGLGLILFAFPMFWAGLYAVKTPNGLLGFIKNPSDEYAMRVGNTFAMNFKLSVLMQFIWENLASLNILGLISVLYLTVTAKPIRRWLLVPAIAFVVLSYLSLRGKAMPTHNFWRVSSSWSILLLPFTAHWIWQQGQVFQSSSRTAGIARIALRTLLIATFALAFGAQTFSRAKFSSFTKADRGVGEFVNAHAARTDKFLIDVSQYNYLHVQIASQRPRAFMLNGSPVRGGSLITGRADADTRKLKSMGIRYVIMTHPQLLRALDANPGLLKVLRQGIWVVYQVK
jgi:hypothetical protein